MRGDSGACWDTQQTAEFTATLAPAKHQGCCASALEPDSVQITKDYFVIVAKFKKREKIRFYNNNKKKKKKAVQRVLSYPNTYR